MFFLQEISSQSTVYTIENMETYWEVSWLTEKLCQGWVKIKSVKDGKISLKCWKPRSHSLLPAHCLPLLQRSAAATSELKHSNATKFFGKKWGNATKKMHFKDLNATKKMHWNTCKVMQSSPKCSKTLKCNNKKSTEIHVKSCKVHQNTLKHSNATKKMQCKYVVKSCKAHQHALLKCSMHTKIQQCNMYSISM